MTENPCATGAHIGSCASCGKLDCNFNMEEKWADKGLGRTAFLLDGVWPEYQKLLAQLARPEDVLIGTLDGRWFPAPNYAWDLPIKSRHFLNLETLWRIFRMRQVADASGAVRQGRQLGFDAAFAKKMVRNIPFDADHLVIAQPFLPFMADFGVLGGRTYAVLMTRDPLQKLQATLDEAAQKYPQSQSLADFRVDVDLVAAETKALENAKIIYTPNGTLAADFGRRARLLDWHLPPAVSHQKGDRFAFLGPNIGRKGLYEMKELARKLPTPLIIFGPDLEQGFSWENIPIERRVRGNFSDIGTIIHPTMVESAPRALMAARQNNIHIVSNRASGLPAHFYEPIGDFLARL